MKKLEITIILFEVVTVGLAINSLLQGRYLNAFVEITIALFIIVLGIKYLRGHKT